MPLRTSAVSEAERNQIEQEWNTERAWSLTQLESTRRSGLRFVKAAKTDEEWTAESRAGIAAQAKRHPSSKEIAEENARWYRELVGGSSATASAANSSHTSANSSREGSALNDAPVPSTSNVLAESNSPLDVKPTTAQSACMPDKIEACDGTQEAPYALTDDESEGQHSDGIDQPEHDAFPSIGVSRALADDQNEDHNADRRAREDIPTKRGQQEQVTTSEKLDPQDMYCLLCKTIVPESDVAGHRTSILHQLSKSSSNSEDANKPLVPPTHYGVKSSNVGYGMLQRLGWVEDTGLGASQLGRKTPLRASEKFDRKGLGVDAKRRSDTGDDDLVDEHAGEGRSAKRPNSSSSSTRPQKAAKPLAKNRKELERHKKREMQMFKEGLAYLNT